MHLIPTAIFLLVWRSCKFSTEVHGDKVYCPTTIPIDEAHLESSKYAFGRYGCGQGLLRFFLSAGGVTNNDQFRDLEKLKVPPPELFSPISFRFRVILISFFLGTLPHITHNFWDFQHICQKVIFEDQQKRCFLSQILHVLRCEKVLTPTGAAWRQSPVPPHPILVRGDEANRPTAQVRRPDGGHRPSRVSRYATPLSGFSSATASHHIMHRKKEAGRLQTETDSVCRLPMRNWPCLGLPRIHGMVKGRVRAVEVISNLFISFS